MITQQTRLRHLRPSVSFYGPSDFMSTRPRRQVQRMEVSEAQRLRTLEDENRKLKKLLAESMPDNTALEELLAKKW
jgi:putative transposase